MWQAAFDARLWRRAIEGTRKRASKPPSLVRHGRRSSGRFPKNSRLKNPRTRDHRRRRQARGGRALSRLTPLRSQSDRCNIRLSGRGNYSKTNRQFIRKKTSFEVVGMAGMTVPGRNGQPRCMNLGVQQCRGRHSVFGRALILEPGTTYGTDREATGAAFGRSCDVAVGWLGGTCRPLSHDPLSWIFYDLASLRS